MGNTKIEWTEKSWNPITGCTPCSPGCEHCYARRMAKRLAGRCGYPADDPFRVTFHEDKLDEPLKWRKPCRVFVCSMGDLFHEDVPDEWIMRVFGVMDQKRKLYDGTVFQILTKRPERMRTFINKWYTDHNALGRLSNIWLGVTAENQEQADRRIPILLDIPAVVRFVSIEPMLGEITLDPSWLAELGYYQTGHGRCEYCGWFACTCGHKAWEQEEDIGSHLDWVIVGGETGPGARPMHPDWARSIRDQCVGAGVPFFFKGWGAFLHTSQMIEDVHWTEFRPSGDHFVKMKTRERLLDWREWNEHPHV